MVPVSLAAGISGAAAVALGTVAIWLGPALLPVQPLPTIRVQDLEVRAEAVSTLEGLVTSRRHGRVLRRVRPPAAAVRAGDPILEFEDLALQASKADLDAEIARLDAQSVKVASSERRTDGAGPLEIRLAALSSLEESYEIARRDFERWETLHAEGLVARLDYEREEREFADIEAQLQAARAGVAAGGSPATEADEEHVTGDLRRAERLRQHLNRLSETFAVKSPWDGQIGQFHVQEGEIPQRGSPLATIQRVARPSLEVDLSEVGADIVVAVLSACGVPGPFPFTVRDGTLRMLVPTVSIRPGGRCRIVVRVRRQEDSPGETARMPPLEQASTLIGRFLRRSRTGERTEAWCAAVRNTRRDSRGRC